MRVTCGMKSCVRARKLFLLLSWSLSGARRRAHSSARQLLCRDPRICDEFGILLICDEVMSGAGRTGKYLASDHWSLRPDLIAFSKGFGAGYVPLGAMVADRRIADAVIDNGGFIHGFTYAGNPLRAPRALRSWERSID